MASEGSLSALRDGQLPFVTVNFLAYNRREPLRDSLTQIRALDYPADRIEVVVVDNASTDGTAAMLRQDFPWVRLVELPENVGTSGWNRGFELGRGDYFLVLDDDCYVSGPDLRRAVAAAELSRADLVSFQVRSDIEDGWYFTDDGFRPGLLGFWGCSALVSRRAIERVKGFDPGIFFGSHEPEFLLRLLDRGLRHLYLPDVVAVHMKGPVSFALGRYRMLAYNYAYMAAKLFRARDAALAIFNLLLGVALAVVHETPAVALSVREITAGLARGLRAREPASAEVSRAYRENYLPYSNPLRFLRSPTERLRRTGEDENRRFEQWRDERRDFYPDRAVVLRFDPGPLVESVDVEAVLAASS